MHGSLARAGKVKGQTPKVDKQPKKKAQTGVFFRFFSLQYKQTLTLVLPSFLFHSSLRPGRAKRREQYNRRFNVVVAPGGKKRSPNSNADKV